MDFRLDETPAGRGRSRRDGAAQRGRQRPGRAGARRRVRLRRDAVEGDGAGRPARRSPCRSRSAATASAPSRSAACCARSAVRPCRCPRWPRSPSACCPSPRSAPADQQRALLPEVADGRVLTGALRDARRARDRHDRAQAGDGYVVTGTKVGVPYAAQAHRILVPTDAGVSSSTRRRRASRCTRTPTSTKRAGVHRAAGRRAVPRADLLSPRRARASSASRWPAPPPSGDGVIAGALALTAAHLASRHQFGKPLATFQAVAQQIADVYITAQTMHLASLVGERGGWRRASTPTTTSTSPRTGWPPNCPPRCRSAITCTAASASTTPTRCTATTRRPRTWPGSSAGSAHRLDLIGDRCSSN